jgi:RNA polymerase sigma factor (sigma-70 family)
MENSSLLDDAALVTRILGGDAQSFEELHRRHERRIYYYALRRLRDPGNAEDVTQEVFLQVFRSLASFEGRSSLLTWMFGIAHNQVCRFYRRGDPGLEHLDSPEIEKLESGETPADRRTEMVRVLRNCSRVLREEVTDGQQEVFHLRYVENLSTRSIAEELGRSTQAIKISLFRTRRTLEDRNRDLAMVLSA